MISIALEVLYRLQYIGNFQRWPHHVIFWKCVRPHFWLLKRFVRHRFECSHLIELKILSKMNGRMALHDFPMRSYKYNKSRKKRVFNRFFTIFHDFSTFVILINSHWKVMESRATTHFAQNFQLYQMAAFETISDNSF